MYAIDFLMTFEGWEGYLIRDHRDSLIEKITSLEDELHPEILDHYQDSFPELIKFIRDHLDSKKTIC